jgi:hypothetical protein
MLRCQGLTTTAFLTFPFAAADALLFIPLNTPNPSHHASFGIDDRATS